MSNEVSKKDFLKRYLENEDESTRKRKKKSKLAKPKANIPCLKIVNEDIDLKSMNFGEKDDDGDDDEAPVVAEVIDERPIEVKLKELYESSRWKKIDSCESSQSSLPDLEKTTSHDRNVKSRRHDSDGDLSPLREQKRHSSNNISPTHNCKQNRNRYDSDGDISPSRSQRQNRSKHNSDSDLSPPRSHKPNKNLKKINSDANISPLHHQSANKIKTKELSKRHDSDSDISPPRHQPANIKNSSRRHDSDGDISPPRHQPANVNTSSTKNSSRRHDSDSDISPPRVNSSKFSETKNKRVQDSDGDLSPPRSSSVKEKGKLDKTLSGLKAGLQNSKSLQKEVQQLKMREKSQLNMLEDEVSGRNADTIIRDRKTGLKRDLGKEKKSKDEEDKKNKEYQQKYEKWGKGTEQRQENLEKIQDDLYEMSKPLARYEDDADLDERLKSIIHDDDPMSAYMRKKKQKESGVSNFPVYTGPPAPPNRFGIKPGFRWDGVDRSNGFEAKYFEKINTSKAVKEEAYLWSVQDM